MATASARCASGCSVTMSAWREPRTYALGVIMLGMAFAEGGANDWLALGIVEGHGADEALGAAGLAVFSVSMTVVRVFGGPLVDRFGRVATLRVLAVTATVGLLLFILAPNVPLVFVGAALWGAGVSLGFPLGMSAAADDPAKAAARVSAAATIGYIAFLCGPPILGLISEHIGLLNTLYILVALIIASGLASGAARPIAGSTVGAGHHARAVRARRLSRRPRRVGSSGASRHRPLLGGLHRSPQRAPAARDAPARPQGRRQPARALGRRLVQAAQLDEPALHASIVRGAG